MRTLYLHVGVHRTGTTSTQRFLRDNFNVLLTKGYLYPYGVKRHDQIVRRLANNEITAQDFAIDLTARADKQLEHITSIVISDEDISLIEDLRIFAPLKEYFDIKLVVALRRQDLWLESWYLQNVKWQWNDALSHLTFDEFFARRTDFFWIDYAARFAHFESIFGPDAVVAGVFEKDDMPEGPIQSFLNMIGIKVRTGFGPFLHRNSSLSPLLSEFMRQLPLDRMAIKERTIVEAACIEVDKTLKTNGSKLIMTAAQREIVMAEYEDSNHKTAVRYVGRETLFREPLPNAEALLADTVLPGQSQDVVEQFVSPVLEALASLMTKARFERDTVEKANAEKVAVKTIKRSQNLDKITAGPLPN